MWSCRQRPHSQGASRDAPNLADPPTSGTATAITSILAVDSPGIDLFRVSRAPEGCSSTASSGAATSFNLGQGSFVPIQLIVSQDGSRAFVIASNRGSVLVFNIDNQTSSAIPLSADAVPVQASLTPDGTRLTLPPPMARFTSWTHRAAATFSRFPFPPMPRRSRPAYAMV